MKYLDIGLESLRVWLMPRWCYNTILYGGFLVFLVIEIPILVYGFTIYPIYKPTEKS